MIKKKKILSAAAISAVAMLSVCSLWDMNTYAAAEKTGDSEIAINSTNFPDAILRKKLKRDYDEDKNGKLSKKELGAVKKLEVKWFTESFEGLQYFYNLEAFDYSSFNMEEAQYDKEQRFTIDLTPNKKLKEVHIHDKFGVLESVNVENCLNMKKFYIGKGDNITDINLKGCKRLKELDAYELKLDKLDLRDSKELRYINIVDSEIKEIELGDKRKVSYCVIDSKGLKKVDLDKINPRYLMLEGLKTGKLSFKHMTNLVKLCISDVKLSSLDVSHNKNLEDLFLEGNGIKKIDTSMLTKLRYLSVKNNRLTKLDVSKNNNLKGLNCDSNKLTKIDLSDNKSIKNLSCKNNKLTKLDLSKNNKLETLYCENNKITKIALAENSRINEIVCSNNKLKQLDVSGKKRLLKLDCKKNDIKELDIKHTRYYRYDASFKIDKNVKLTKNTKKDAYAYEIYNIYGMGRYDYVYTDYVKNTVYLAKGCEDANVGDFIEVADHSCRTKYVYPLSMVEAKGVKYYSSNSDVISVDKTTGKMKALKNGTATITIDWFGIKYSAEFKVVNTLDKDTIQTLQIDGEKEKARYEVIEKIKKKYPEIKINEKTYKDLINIKELDMFLEEALGAYIKGEEERHIYVYDPYAYRLCRLHEMLENEGSTHGTGNHKFKIKTISEKNGRIVFNIDRKFTYQDVLFFNAVSHNYGKIEYKQYNDTFKQKITIENTATGKKYNGNIMFKEGSNEAELTLNDGKKLPGGATYMFEIGYKRFTRGSVKEFTLK